MDKQILVKANLSDTFTECWNNDYGHQVYDHVLGTFRRNGAGEWSHFVSHDKTNEKFLFPQTDGGNILLDYDKPNGKFTLYASLDEKSSSIFFEAWKDCHFGSLNPDIEEKSNWKNNIETYKIVDKDAKDRKSFAKHFALDSSKGTVRTDTYMREINNAKFKLYPTVAVEREKDEDGRNCWKTTMFGTFNGQEFKLVGGTEWKYRYEYDTGDKYLDEMNRYPVMYKKDGNTFKKDDALLSKFNDEVLAIYKYNGSTENAVGVKSPYDIMFYSMVCVEHDMGKDSMWRKGIPNEPSLSADKLYKEFEASLHKKDNQVENKKTNKVEQNKEHLAEVKFFIRPEAVYHAVENNVKGFSLQGKDEHGKFSVFIPENGGNVTAKLIENSKSFNNWVVVNTTVGAGFKKQYETMFLNIGGADLKGIAKQINKRIELKQSKVKAFMKKHNSIDENSI